MECILSDGDAFAFMKVYKREQRLLALLKKHGLSEKGILALRCGFNDAHIEKDVIAALEANEDYLSMRTHA